MITSFDPRSAVPIEDVADASSADDVARQCAVAARAADSLEALGRHGRAAMLRTMADSLEDQREVLVAGADRETALGTARLEGELTRTTFQLRFFAEVLEDGGYLEATIDHAGATPMGPRPDLRRMLRPIGPVAVFGASNFPFAFSVPGGDTASALAAGCSVVVKGHDAHPRTSQLCAQALRRGAADAGVEVDVVSLVFGRAAGTSLVADPNIRAVGFTGSVGGGRVLHDIAASRPSPIPFYGELGALNPLIVCSGAADARGAALAQDLTGSFTLGVGQFCTKPGLAFVPRGAAGDALVDRLVASVQQKSASVMLSRRVNEGFVTGAAALLEAAGVTPLAQGRPPTALEGYWGTPLLLEAAPTALSDRVLDECFGPILVLVRYDSAEELRTALDRVGPSLTATIHAEPSDTALARQLLDKLSSQAGRIVWNGYPTGVAVAWAMHHGGPHPAASDVLHTSVGAHAIRRWLRPVAYQDVPAAFLPPELVDHPVSEHQVPRRVNGHLAG